MAHAPESEEAFALIAAGRYDDAAALCSRVLALRPADVALLHAHGIAELRLGRYAQALESLVSALAQHPDDPILLNNCGEAYRLLGETEQAFECFKRAIQIEFDIPMAHVNIGLAMRALGKVREAEHFFKNAIMLDSSLERAHLELAELYREEGYVAEALDRYRSTLEIAPGSARAHRELGSLLAREGSTREALAALEEAVRCEPGDWVAHLALTKTRHELCAEGEAKASYLRAIELYPRLSPHAKSRVASVRRRDASQWAEHGADRYWRLARSNVLQLPALKTIPEDAAAAWPRNSTNNAIAPELFLCRLRNAEVLPGDFTVLANDATLLVNGLVNWPHHYDQRSRFVVHCSDDGRLLLDLPERSATLEQPCALLGGTGDDFDWLFGGVARLWALEQQPRAAALPVIVAEGLAEWRVGLLEALGVPAERLLPLPEDRTFLCRELYVPSLPIADEWISPLAVQFLRRRLHPIATVPTAAARRIYLSRAAMATRKVANEAELVPLLSSHGFEIVDQKELKLLDQLRLFAGAQAVIAVDDEILASLVVAPQGAKIGAIIANGIFRPRAFFVSAQAGQDFTYLQAEPRFESNPMHAECDVVLPPESLARWLAAL